MTRLRIVIFHQEFFFSGGAERLIFEEMAALEKKGYQVEAWAPLVARKRCFPDQIHKFRIGGFFRYVPLIPRELIVLLTCLLAPLLVLRFRQADLFYGVNQAGPYLAWVAAKIWRRPYLVFMPYPVGLLYPRQVDLESGLLVDLVWPLRWLMKAATPIIRFLDWQVITQAAAVLTTGAYAKSVFENIYRRQIIDAPSGADPLPKAAIKFKSRWHGVIRLGGFQVKKPYILVTNRIVPKKKFEYALKALALLGQKNRRVNLVIAGGVEKDQNEYLDRLLRLVARLKLTGKVFFTGFLDRELREAYLEAAVYLYPAPEEDYGKGMVEAMAAGVPVVAWNKAGPTGIVVNGTTGFLAKQFQVKDLADKITRLLTDRQLNQRFGQAGWQQVRHHFTKEHHQRQLEAAIVRATEANGF